VTSVERGDESEIKKQILGWRWEAGNWSQRQGEAYRKDWNDQLFA